MDNSNLAKRMKKYEAVSKGVLINRMPVIIRIDGKAFHTFTKGFKRPFDEVLIKTMQETTKYLCENIQGCVLGYTQSDEITLVLVDYQKFETSAWFDYEIQKMCSIAASMATMAFNKYFMRNIKEESCSFTKEWLENGDFNPNYKNKDLEILWWAHSNAVNKGAMFDARVFNIPKEEVTNCVYWRQLDASRNSVQMVGHANFSHKELQNKSCNDIQDMLMTQKGINWNNFPTYQKRGSCIIKEEYFVEDKNGEQYKYEEGCCNPMEDDCVKGRYRTRWVIDKDIPIFKGEGREYIDKLVYVGEQ